MKVYGIWHGGASYSPGGIEDIEEFDSIQHAKDVLDSRYRNGHGWLQQFRYLNRSWPVVSVLTPAVEQDSEIWLWPEVPDGDLYPWRIVKFGPRGGVVVEEG